MELVDDPRLAEWVANSCIGSAGPGRLGVPYGVVVWGESLDEVDPGVEGDRSGVVEVRGVVEARGVACGSHSF